MDDETKLTLKFAGRTVETTTGRLSAMAQRYQAPRADELPDELGPDDLYPVPPASRFKNAADRTVTFIEAPDLEELADDLIGQWEELGHLVGSRMRVLWKDKGTSKAMGKCTKASGFWSMLTDLDFVVWIGAEDVRESFFTRRQVEALLYHELSHARYDEDTGQPHTVDHDAEIFYAELARYGVWARDLQRFGQLSLSGAFDRGDGLEEPRFGRCQSCSAIIELASPCASCAQLFPEARHGIPTPQDPLEAVPAPMPCHRCGQVVPPEDAAGLYQLDQLCFECREGAAE
jgi:hypothetical protein